MYYVQKKAGYNRTLIYKICTPIIMLAFLPYVSDFMTLKLLQKLHQKGRGQ